MRDNLFSFRTLFFKLSAFLILTTPLGAAPWQSECFQTQSEEFQLRSLNLDQKVFTGGFYFLEETETVALSHNPFKSADKTCFFEDFSVLAPENCSQIFTGDTFNGVGFIDDGTNHLKAANDFIVPGGTKFSLQTIKLEVVTLGGMPTTFDVSFYKDNLQGVGAQIGVAYFGLTAGITPNGVFGQTDYPQWTVEITVPVPIEFNNPDTEDEHFWVGISAAPSTTSDYSYWVSSIYETSSVTYPTWQSLNGSIWEVYKDDNGENVEGIMTVAGECDDADPAGNEGCTWTVHVWDDFFGDEVSWTLKDSSNNTLLSGGNYSLGYDEIKAVISEGPLTFYIESMGTTNDNKPHYEVSNEIGILVSGRLNGGTQATYTDLNCDSEPQGEICENAVIDSFPFNESFEDDSPLRDCWLNEYVNGAVNWIYRAGAGNGGAVQAAHGGAKNASFSAETYSQFATKLTSPRFDFSAMQNATLNFWYANQAWVGDQNELRVYYKNSANGSWTVIPGAVYTSNVNAWTEVTLDLPESAGKSDYYIAFEGLNNWGYGVVVDDMTVDAELAPEDPGCLDAPNGQWGDYTPYCIGLPEVVADLAWTGEYSIVHLTAGVEYTFSSSVATDFITISDEDGTGSLVYGQSPVVFTPDTDGAYRFYTHLDEECNVDSSFRDRMIQCGSPVIIEEPDYDCFQGDGITQSFDDAILISESDFVMVADDFTVAEGIEFTIRQITMDVNQPEIPNNAVFNIREDVGGVPGNIVETAEMAPTSSVLYSVSYGDPVYHLTFDLVTPIVLGEGTYWIQPEMTVPGGDDVWWVATSTGSTGAPAVWSFDSGSSWEVYDSEINMVFFAAGDCEEIPEESGCLDAPFGQWGDYTPVCFGQPETVVEIAWPGEYSIVHLTAGVEYTFSSSVSTDFITISDEDGTLSLAYGQSPLVWTPDQNGAYRFYTHLDDQCNTDTTFRDRLIQCGEQIIIEEPDFDCVFGDGITSSFDDAFNITESAVYRVADDFTIEPGMTLFVRQITIDVNQPEIPDNATINIREDNMGIPGAVLHTIENAVPTEAIAYSSAFGDPIYHLVYDVDPNLQILLTEGTYWLEPKMSVPSGTVVWWLATSANTQGSAAYISDDDGASWNPNDDNLDTVFFVAGDCGFAGTNDIADSDFAYWPNPVKDELNISSKKPVESVSVFNLAGQKLIDGLKLNNGKISMKTLAPGTYVFRVLLEGNKVETFKIIKK